MRACVNCTLLQAARRRARKYREGRFEMHLFPPAATIHQYTQSYFLSGTDATGVPIKWTRIIKLGNAPGDGMPNRLRLPHNNAKPAYARSPGRTGPPRRRTPCGMCEINRQDFVCLGRLRLLQPPFSLDRKQRVHRRELATCSYIRRQNSGSPVPTQDAH